MQKLNILNSKEIKRLKELLVNQFNYSFQEDYAYLETEKGKVYIISKDISKLDLDKLRIDRYGLYLGEKKGNTFRLSMEASQLLFKEAKENKVKLDNLFELNEKEIREYFQGMDIDKPELKEENKLVLLQFREDVFGCARLKEGKILNFLPKIHRGEAIV
ncbi:MAG: hypothetical protein ABIG93_05265 [archaeon]|nr:hypothetical protein [Nanoarchaeota archaeon]